MKIKKLFPIYAIILVSLTFLYVLFAIKPLGKEYQFSPVWKISTSNPTIKELPEDAKKLYFHLGQTMGYFSEDGDISLFRSFPSKVAISDSHYAVYNTQAGNIPFYNNKGDELGIINTYGFPYFKDDLIFVMLPGGCSFAKCDETGNVVWTYEGTLPITAFSAKEKYTAVGFTNGYIKVFNNESGTLETTYAPGGSDFPVILGLDISDDGQYIASISGHNQQRFVLSHREKNQQKIIYHKFLNTELPYRTLVHFCKDNNRIIYNYENYLGIYNISEERNTIIPVKNKIISMEESDDIVYLLSKDKNNYTVYLVENTDALEGQFSFTADSAFIKTDGNNLYVGKDNSISRISVTKE